MSNVMHIVNYWSAKFKPEGDKSIIALCGYIVPDMPWKEYKEKQIWSKFIGLNHGTKNGFWSAFDSNDYDYVKEAIENYELLFFDGKQRVCLHCKREILSQCKRYENPRTGLHTPERWIKWQIKKEKLSVQ